MTAVFTGLALLLLTIPAEALSQHGIDIFGQPPSAFAEIRAYYAGTLTVFALIFYRGTWPATPQHTVDGLSTFALLMGLFVAVRCVSFVVDGPPTIMYAYLMWGGELVGFIAANILLNCTKAEIPNAKRANPHYNAD